jgi:hypothetical protein
MSHLPLFAAALLLSAAYAQEPINQVIGPRMTPPTLSSVTPLGVARGTTAEMTLEGLNLAGASAIYFSEPGIKGKVLRVKELPDLPDVRLGSNGTASTVDVGPLPPRNQVTVEVEVAAEAPVGPVKFRVHTPLGTSPEGSFLVEPYFGEAADREPNDNLEAAVEAFLPAVLTGTIGRPGDLDFFKIAAKAGEELVFENQAPMIGSTLQPVIRIMTPEQAVLREFGYDGSAAARFSHRFDKAGTYYVRIGDYESSGRGSNFYRILVGKLPVAVSAYPLGVKHGAQADVAIDGFYLGKSKLTVAGKPPAGLDNILLRPETPSGPAFNEVKLAVGADPEVEAASTKNLTLPVTVNGRIAKGEYQDFRFRAAKGQKVAIEVEARRLGSELDSFVEVLDSQARPIERATVRATWETNLVLRDHDSASRGLRVQAWNVLNVGDYVMVGNEVLRVDEVPDGPDEDMLLESFGGQRKAYFGTTPEAHGIDRSVYKVQIHPPGAKFSPNGLPLVRLYYRNDDGGPGYGKDSFLDFTAPADGEYIVRLRDVRNWGGKEYAYRLHVREPRPDFRLAVNPRNPNVPRGGSIPLTVTALRMEGYDGPIEVELSQLPKGLKATRNTIPAGIDNCTILLSADADVALNGAVAFDVTGHAAIDGKTVAHIANPEDKTKLIALAPKPDILVAAETKVVELEPGQSADIKVKVARQNGFIGRVPIQVRDLPNRVRVADSGLNGVLVTEEESERSFKILALPNADPTERVFYVAGTVETRSPQQNLYAAPTPILVKVKPKAQVAAR